jgi:hypothetical protein
MAGILTAVARDGPTSQARTGQWAGIVKKLRRPGGVLGLLLEDGRSSDRAGQDWNWKTTSAGFLTIDCAFAAAPLRLWAQEARAEALARSAKAAVAASKSWWAWVDDQLRVGAGGLHRISKREDIVADRVVDSPMGPSLGLQQMLDADRKVWSKVWTRFQSSATAPWRGLSETWTEDLPWLAPLPVIAGDHLATAAKQFKRRTGLGSDALNPRWLGWV